MRILLLNDAYFQSSLRALGHEVFFASPAPEADLKLPLEPVQLEDILRECPFKPDFILISDSINIRAALLGLEKVAIPRVFYGVDSPMNAFWQSDYARVFDLAFLDQRASVEKLQSDYPDAEARFHWLPLAADGHIYRKLDLDKTCDIAFVGSVNERLRPKRSWMLKALSRHFDVRVFDGGGNRSLPPDEVVRIYNQSKIVLNENLFPGLNLRTFEVMACGACLLTEESDQSWRTFFREWEHLVTFLPENLIERVRVLLQNDKRRSRIARDGMTLVRKCHTIDNRAEWLLRIVAEHLQGKTARANKSKSYHLGKAFMQLADRWPRQPVRKLKSEGIRLLLTETAEGSESASLHFELAAQALSEGRLADAWESLHRALQLDPAHLRSRWSLFWCLREMGDHAEATREIQCLCHHLRLKTFERGFLERIGTGTELTASDYFFFAELLEKAGWLLEPGFDRTAGHPCRWNAFDAYQKAIVTDPKFWPAYLHCAEILEHFQSPDFAVILVEEAARLRPRDAGLKLKLADLLLRSYRRREGLAQLVQYLIKSADSDKWEKVEQVRLSEAEWHFLLDNVRDSCQGSSVENEQPNVESDVRRRALQRIPKKIQPRAPLKPEL